MTLPILLFFVCAGLSVGGALVLILAREPIHSALALVLVMISLAVLYLLLGAAFIAAVQIIVYAGAIMVLFVFVIMLLNAGQEQRTRRSRVAHWIGLPLAFFLTADLAWWVARRREGDLPRRHGFRDRAFFHARFLRCIFSAHTSSLLKSHPS